MATVLKSSKSMKKHRIWTRIRLSGLIIKPFETERCNESNGTPPEPQNCHIKFKIEQNSNEPHREKCILNYSVNRSFPLDCCNRQPLTYSSIVRCNQTPELVIPQGLVLVIKFKGAPPIAADPAGFPDFRFFIFRTMRIFVIFQ